MRAGYAGDDTPKAIIPTSYGYKSETADGDVSMGEAVEDGKVDLAKKKLFLGQHGPSIWRDQMEIGNPVRDGLSMCLKFFFVFILFNGMHSPRFRSHRTIDISCFSGCHALQRFRASYSGH